VEVSRSARVLGAAQVYTTLMILLLCACPSRHAGDDGAAIAPEQRRPNSATDLLTVGEASAPHIYVSSDGLVRTQRPVGDAWECLEQMSSPPKPAITLIKCRQRDSARFFFLMMKDYQVDPGAQIPVDEIIRDILPGTYDDLFESFTITRTTDITHQGVVGRELTIVAKHAALGTIHKRERFFVRGDHVLVVSAEGLPPLFDTFAAQIDAWILGADFLNLAPP